MFVAVVEYGCGEVVPSDVIWGSWFGEESEVVEMYCFGEVPLSICSMIDILVESRWQCLWSAFVFLSMSGEIFAHDEVCRDGLRQSESVTK